MIRLLFSGFILLSFIADTAVASNVSYDASIIASKLNKNRKKITDLEKKQREILGTLYTIQKSIEDYNTKSGKKHTALLSAQGSVKKVANEINTLKNKIDGQKASLGKRLKALYQWNNLGSLRYIIASAKSGELERNLRYLKEISNRDIEVIKAYSKNLSKLKSKQERLKEKVKILIAQKKQYQKVKDSLAKQQKNKSKILSAFKKTRNSALLNIESLKKQAKALSLDITSSELENLFDSAFFESKGRMSAPLEGRAATKFGLYYSYDYHFRLNKKGVVYKPRKSAMTAHSIFHGKVSFVGEVDGYGKTIIIDHGDNYYSVYSNLSRVSVNKHAEVSKGEEIADLQLVNGNPQPLYFEIRHFSEALNPEEWIGKSLIVNEKKATTEVSQLGKNI